MIKCASCCASVSGPDTYAERQAGRGDRRCRQEGEGRIGSDRIPRTESREADVPG